MVTIGNNDYVLSRPVIMHELAHQWYGDQSRPPTGATCGSTRA